MKVLKRSAEDKALLLRDTKQPDSQEDRLTTLNKEISDLQQKKSQEQRKLDAMVQEIALEKSVCIRETWPLAAGNLLFRRLFSG